MLNEWLQQTFFQIGNFAVSAGILLLLAAALLAIVLVQRFAIRRWLRAYLLKKEIPAPTRKKARQLIYLVLFASIFQSFLLVTEWNPVLWKTETYALNLANLFGIGVLWSWTWLLEVFLVRILFLQLFEPPKEPPAMRPSVVSQRDAAQQEGRSGKRKLEVFLYYTAILLSLVILKADLAFFDGKIGKLHLSLRLSQILIAAWVFVAARLAVWVIVHFVLTSVYKRKQINIGLQFAINQLLNYLIFFFALMFALNLIGVNITLLASGAAALLLGVGLGLQQTFNDFFCGLILLFERTVELGDVVEVNGLVGKVRRIGLRSSIVQTRDNRSVIVPNSKLIVNSVTNWSHDDEIAWFVVSVGVAFGSDTAKVKDILLQAAKQHRKVLPHPEPFVRFSGFGEYTLQFDLIFWSAEFMRIDDVRSDLRFAIDAAFREQGVLIPFPQRNIWFRNAPPTATDQDL